MAWCSLTQRAFGEHFLVTPRLTCDRDGVLQLHAGWIFCTVQVVQSPGLVLPPTCMLFISKRDTVMILPLGCCHVAGGHTAVLEHNHARGEDELGHQQCFAYTMVHAYGELCCGVTALSEACYLQLDMQGDNYKRLASIDTVTASSCVIYHVHIHGSLGLHLEEQL